MGKSLLTGFIMLFFLGVTFAQESKSENDGFATWTLDVNVSSLDFYTPTLKEFSSFKEKMAIGPDLSLTRHWSKVGLGISTNILSPSVSFLKEDKNGVSVNKYIAMVGPGLVYNFQNQYLIKASSPVAPFVFANALASAAQITDKSDAVRFGFGIPVGAGMYFKIADKVGLNIKAGYAFGITDYYESNVFWSAGATLGMPKLSKEEPEEILPVDTDGDGIPDYLDECPDVYGLAEFNGCPDSDGDGIPDHLDECPYEAGPVENKGCPIDEEAKKDKAQKGIQSVHFETGKADLNAESYPILNRVATLLSDNPNFHISIEGHTDNTGGDAINEKLSLDRANSGAEYLISKGIDAERVSSIGFGSKQPIADNSTVEGRAENRRTIFRLLLAN